MIPKNHINQEQNSRFHVLDKFADGGIFELGAADNYFINNTVKIFFVTVNVGLSLSHENAF